jgi:DNA-binding NarL/FixJ family response regulator
MSRTAPGRDEPFGAIVRSIRNREHSGAMAAAPKLTSRERQVLVLIADGYTAARIAKELGIEVSTVRKHRENLMRKLDLHNTAELVLYVVRHSMRRT